MASSKRYFRVLKRPHGFPMHNIDVISNNFIVDLLLVRDTEPVQEKISLCYGLEYIAYIDRAKQGVESVIDHNEPNILLYHCIL